MEGVDPSLQQLADDVIDRLLPRGAALFPDVAPDAGFGGGQLGSAGPPSPDGGLVKRIEDAGAELTRRRLALQQLEDQAAQIVGAAGQAAQQHRTAVQQLREQARAQVDAILPVANSAAGAQLLVSTLDQIVGQLQEQVAAGRAANAEAAARLRELADAYRV